MAPVVPVKLRVCVLGGLLDRGVAVLVAVTLHQGVLGQVAPLVDGRLLLLDDRLVAHRRGRRGRTSLVTVVVVVLGFRLWQRNKSQWIFSSKVNCGTISSSSTFPPAKKN